MGRDIGNDAEIERVRVIEGTGTSTPPTGYGYIYQKGGLFYFKNDNGNEYNLTSLHFLNDHTDVDTAGVDQNYLLFYDTGDGWKTTNNVNLRNIIAKGTLIVSGTAQFVGDIYSVPYTNFSGTCTINGWSSFTFFQIWYKTLGNMVLVKFHFEGTSSDVVANFTLPYAVNDETFTDTIIRIADNGINAIGYFYLVDASNVVTCQPSITGSSSSWTNSGTKKVIGQFFYFK